jgi:nucleoside-diphosphate-sugar epimerase
MKIVVVGASGNVGTSVLRAAEENPTVTEVVGVARRPPPARRGRVRWYSVDIARDALLPIFEGADAVVHLAWLFQPTHDARVTWGNNVHGSIRVFEAVAQAHVPTLVYSSSVGSYSPARSDMPVDESWPTHAIPTAAYGREKSYLERVLDTFERDRPNTRVVRFRPAFIFKREASEEQRQLFLGPLLPRNLLRPGRLPAIPGITDLRIQAVHSHDVGRAMVAAITNTSARGAYNLAASPVIDNAVLSRLLDAPTVPIPQGVVRTALATAWHLHAVPASPGLIELMFSLPLLDASRARRELAWEPEHSATDAVSEVLEGIADRAHGDTPALREAG